jgi:Ca2+-binding RTX toxin-like protein
MATAVINIAPLPQTHLPPTDIKISRSAVSELAETEAVVGTVFATDPDRDEHFFYALVNDADDRFAINDNGVLVVADGLKLDFEQARYHDVTVRVIDRDGLSYDQRLRIIVKDVKNEIAHGSDENDRFVGGSGRDRLFGAGGNDTLTGGLGNDVLDGGEDRDVFVFKSKLSKTNAANRKANLDKILDFSVADDKISLSKSIFNKLGKKGELSGQAFWTGTNAHDASDRVIYNKKTGALFYDSDGVGSKAAIQFVTLDKRLSLSAWGFLVI